jgi:uncharacterized membrane protein YjgN (DUF898 family)
MADTCPKCGFAEVGSDRCLQCGVVIALYQASLEKLRRGPQARPSAAPSGFAAPAAAQPAPTAVTAPVRPPVAAATVPRLTATPAAAGGRRRARFMGSGAALFGIHVVNVLLTLVTFGIYFFWAKVKVRAYLLSETEFDGDRFAYHGTGRETFVGFLKALVFFFIPITALNLLPELLGASEVVRSALMFAAYTLASFFVPMAMIGARRYRLSRTSWRGIRFSLRAKTWDFVRLWMWNTFLVALTFGLFYPVYITRRQDFMTRNMWFGSERFGFDGKGRDLFWPFVGMLLLFPLTLGLSWFMFSAKKTRYFAEHTTFGSARFASTMRALPLAWLTLSNLVVLVLTLGLTWPWLSVRSLRFAYANLSLDGPLALDTITQQAQTVTATGEGLAGFLDADLGLT